MPSCKWINPAIPLKKIRDMIKPTSPSLAVRHQVGLSILDHPFFQGINSFHHQSSFFWWDVPLNYKPSTWGYPHFWKPPRFHSEPLRSLTQVLIVGIQDDGPLSLADHLPRWGNKPVLVHPKMEKWNRETLLRWWNITLRITVLCSIFVILFWELQHLQSWFESLHQSWFRKPWLVVNLMGNWSGYLQRQLEG